MNQDDKKFIQGTLDEIAGWGDGRLEYHTKDIERICKIALSSEKISVATRVAHAEFEVQMCECGTVCPVLFLHIDEGGARSCPDCYAQQLIESGIVVVNAVLKCRTNIDGQFLIPNTDKWFPDVDKLIISKEFQHYVDTNFEHK